MSGEGHSANDLHRINGAQLHAATASSAAEPRTTGQLPQETDDGDAPARMTAVGLAVLFIMVFPVMYALFYVLFKAPSVAAAFCSAMVAGAIGILFARPSNEDD